MRLLILLPLASLIAACGSDNHAGDAHSDESYNCEAETRDDEFVVGLTKPGAEGQVTFELMSAMPAPPARGDNTWLLQVDTQSGPMTDAAIVVTPFMPDHQHGTPIDTQVQSMPTAGQYQLSPVNMWMPGLWEITVSAAGAPAVDDSVVFRFCIPS